MEKTQIDTKKTVLIIEDDVFLGKAYELEFSRMQVSVVLVNDGLEAIEYLKGEPPAVVLLDLLLPGMSGLDILAAIRGNDRWKNVPVIVLTNLDDQQFIDKTKSFGVDDYMVKANTAIHDIVDKAKAYLA